VTKLGAAPIERARKLGFYLFRLAEAAKATPWFAVGAADLTHASDARISASTEFLEEFPTASRSS
jgi:hypothetical protein